MRCRLIFFFEPINPCVDAIFIILPHLFFFINGRTSLMNKKGVVRLMSIIFRHTFSGYFSILSTNWMPAQFTKTSILLNLERLLFTIFLTFVVFVKSQLKNKARLLLNFFFTSLSCEGLHLPFIITLKPFCKKTEI